MSKTASAEELVAALRAAGASVWTSQVADLQAHSFPGDQSHFAHLGRAISRRHLHLQGIQCSRHWAGGPSLPKVLMRQLVSFKWKLGVSIRSNNAKSLNRAFVTAELVVADSSSNTTTHVFELSVPEFQVCSCSL